MSIINFGNGVAVVGLILLSFLFSRGVIILGLFAVVMMIVGLLMNPPKCKEDVS